MTIKVEWGNPEHTVIITEMQGKWTWDEYHTLIDASVRMMKSVTHPVDLINLRHPDAVEPPGNPIPHIQRAMRAYPANHRLTINAGATQRGVTLQRIFRQMFPWLNRRFFNVATLDEAWAIIETYNAEGEKPRTLSRR